MSLLREWRWALVDSRGLFIGKYAWPDWDDKEPSVRTFATRKLAREGKRTLNNHNYKPKVVKVMIQYVPEHLV